MAGSLLKQFCLEKKGSDEFQFGEEGVNWYIHIYT